MKGNYDKESEQFLKKEDIAFEDDLNEDKDRSKKTITPIRDLFGKKKRKTQASDLADQDEPSHETDITAEANDDSYKNVTNTTDETENSTKTPTSEDKTDAPASESTTTNETDEAAESLETLDANPSKTSDEKEAPSQINDSQMNQEKAPIPNDITDETELPSATNTTADAETNQATEAKIAPDAVTTKLSEINEKVTLQNKTNEDMNDNIASMLEEITATQEQIQKDFQTKLKYDEHKEQTIDTLHRELQEYKDDIIKSAMKPLINDLIFVNDNIFKLVDNLRSSEDALDPDKILNLMESITTDIDNVLYRQGIEAYTSPEEKVNLRNQTIFQTIPINDKSKEKHIAKRVRQGYEWDEKVIRKESVSVYVHDDSLVADEVEESKKDEARQDKVTENSSQEEQNSDYDAENETTNNDHEGEDKHE